MKILELIAITIICAAAAAGICAVIFGMLPWMIRTWRQINYEEKRRREEEEEAERARLAAKVIPLRSSLYTYDKNRRLVNMGEHRSTKW